MPRPVTVSPGVDAMREALGEFEDFADLVFRTVIPGCQGLTPMQRIAARYMQYGPSRRIVAAFRGLGKSYLAASYAVWRLFHDPEEQVLVLSGHPDRAGDFSQWARLLLENPQLPFLKFLRPNKGQRDSRLAWDVGPATFKHSSSFAAFSAGSGIQGRRATLVIPDDVEMKNNSESDLKRSRLLRQVLDVANMLLPDRRSDVLGLGTFQSLNSIYKQMIAERGFDALIIPARVPKSVDEYQGFLPREIATLAESSLFHGQPTDTRFSDAELSIREKTVGPIQWMLEYMMSTTMGDRHAHPFPLERLVVWDGVNPHGAPSRIVHAQTAATRIEDMPCCGLPGDGFYGPVLVDDKTMLPYAEIAMSIDPSGSGSNDEAAYTVMGAVPGQIHLIAFGGEINGVEPKALKRLADVARNYRVRVVYCESNMQAYIALLENAFRAEGVNCRIEPVRSTIKKEDRIIKSIEPFLYASQVIVSRSALEREWGEGLRSGDPRWQERLLQYQLAMFRRGEKRGSLSYDDRVDSLAIGLNELGPKYLNTGTTDYAETVRVERDAQDYDDWKSNIFGDIRGRGSRKEEPKWTTF